MDVQLELDLAPYHGETPDEARERRIKNAVGAFLKGKKGVNVPGDR